MSDVEKFWAALEKFGFPNWKPWSRLSGIEQHQVVQGINLILARIL